jgi:hypothetical protein
VEDSWGETRTIGSWVTLGHGCVVQNVALLGDSAVAGVPARLLDRVVDDECRAAWRGFKRTHVALCERYREGLGRQTVRERGASNPSAVFPSRRAIDIAAVVCRHGVHQRERCSRTITTITRKNDVLVH